MGGGTPPSPRSLASLPQAWSLRSLAFVRNHPPHFGRPVYATALGNCMISKIKYNFVILELIGQLYFDLKRNNSKNL